MWKDFFYFSKRERRGMLLLIIFIAGIFLGRFFFAPKELPPVEALELSVEPGAADDENQTTARTSGYSKQTHLPEKRTYYQQPEKMQEPPKKQDYPTIDKLSAGQTIEINASDTAQLMKIPGIGAAFAKRIISYRNLLGGYSRIEQLQEVYGMYEELYAKITPYITVNPDLIQPVPVNTASLDRLKAHPYLNFYQAKAIMEMRKKKGKLTGIAELKLLEEFTAEDLERMKIYLEFIF
jgi:competence ComEA-like helix-hairpin-helix protein